MEPLKAPSASDQREKEKSERQMAEGEVRESKHEKDSRYYTNAGLKMEGAMWKA